MKQAKKAEEKVQDVQLAKQPVVAAHATEADELKPTVLVETEKYLNTGSHIGTKFKSGDMRKYIYKVRKDGLNVLDVQTIDGRLKAAAKFLSKFSGEKVAVISRKSYGQTPAKEFAKALGGIALCGRFIPGTFTNPQCTRFVEPQVVVVTDPEYDVQAIEEASVIRVPVIALASTNNSLKNIDISIPINNKGRKSIALAYWILAREILKEKGLEPLSKTVDDFEYKMKEGEEEEKRFEKPEGKNRRFKTPLRRPGQKPFGRGFGGPRTGGAWSSGTGSSSGFGRQRSFG